MLTFTWNSNFPNPCVYDCISETSPRLRRLRGRVGAELQCSVTRKLLKLNCLRLTTCLFITVLIKNHSDNTFTAFMKENPPGTDSLCVYVFYHVQKSNSSQALDGGLMNHALRKWQTSLEWAFSGRHVELVITAHPTHYFPPLSIQSNPSLPCGRSLRQGILGSVWTQLGVFCSKAV